MENIDPNAQTIHVYNDEYEKYLAHTPLQHPQSQSTMLQWIERTLGYIKPGGTVLEIGSATPRDAAFMRSKGYSVQCSDGTPNFVNYMNSVGEPAILLNILTDEIPQTYDLIFANAVFPHFTDEELRICFRKMHDALNDDGIISFNVKQGDGETWIEEKTISKRYTNFQQPETIRALVEQSGFEILMLEDKHVGNPPNHIWIRVIARKV